MGRQGLLHDPPGGNIEDSLEAHIIDEQKSIQGNNNTINSNLQQTPPTTTKKKQSSILRFTTTQPTRKRENITDNTTEEIENDPQTEHWGDAMQQKPEGTYRICFENINGLGFDVHHNIKQDRFITWARENEIDAMGWAEVNLNWRMMTPSEKLRERLRQGKWDKLSVSTAHNIHEKLTRYQPGGVSLITFDHLSHRVSSSGSDPSGMGRWTWQTIRCKTRNIQLVTAYQPNITVGDDKQTVYAQQKRHLKYTTKSTLCPREAFRADLTVQLNAWTEKNDVIILMLDANDDLRNGPTHQWLTETMGLRNCLHEQHSNLPPPSTYTRNFRNKPIDGCYVSPGLPIQKAGFLPFRVGIGDHRILFIDIDINTWCEGDLFRIVPQNIRRLQCGDIRIVSKFQRELNNLLEKRNVSERIDKLYSNFQIPLTPVQLAEYERIDTYVTESCLAAEKRCRKVRAGNVPFSPLVDKAAKTIYLWNLLLSKRRGTKVSSSLIRRTSKKCEIIIDPTLTDENIRTLRNNAIKRYKTLKPEAKQHREQFISDLADAIEEVYGTKKASSVRSLTVMEEQRTINRQIKMKLQGINNGSISRLEIQNPNNPQEYIWTENKDLIETSLIRANKKKFSLADNTPFRQQPLLDQCGVYADTQESRNILLGTYDATNFDEGTRLYIRHLKVSDAILNRPPISNKITVCDFQDYWRKVREKTSSSPSGRHFGQWKSIAKSNHLSSIFTKMISLPMEAGFAPRRWCQKLECSVEKKGKRLRPDELRTIVLLEADYNQCMKLIFGKRMMRNCEFSPDYPASQYGTKRGCKAIEAVRLKRMTLDIIRLKRQPATIITTDLHSCYDRIVHSVASLSAQKNGVQPEPIHALIDSLQNSSSSVRTAYGDSTRTHESTPETPYHGTGQGSGASPAVWFVITIVLIEALLHERVGTFITMAISLNLIRFPAILFVDDTDFIITGPSEYETATSILSESQRTLLLWSALLHATGGSLRPEKCRWSLIDFKWTSGKPSYKSQRDCPGSLVAYSSDRRLELVKRLDPSQSVEILGVYMNAIGTDDKEYTRSIEKIEDWDKKITDGTIYKKAVYTALHSTIYRNVTYRLPATQFSPYRCTQMNFKLHRHVLSKMGVNNKIGNSYRYAPLSVNGLGLMDVRLEQIICHLQELVSHVGRHTLNGLATQAEIELCQLHVGSGRHLWKVPYAYVNNLLPPCEIKYLLRECAHFRIEIVGEYNRFGLQRIHDRNLMDELFDSPMSHSDIALVNQCRLYLQVLTLADIANGEGTRIEQTLYDGILSPHRKSKHKWPRQVRPPRRAWKIWQQAIDTIWTNHGVITPALRNWTSAPQQHWRWHFDRISNTLYECTNDTVTEYEPLDHLTRRDRYYFSPFGRPGHQVPPTASPILPTFSNNAHCCTPGYSIPTIEPRVMPNTFTAALPLVEPELRDWLQYSFFEQQEFESIYQLISSNTAIIVIDGSFLPDSQIATASWVIAGPKGPVKAVGYCRLPDGNSSNDPYRAELFGLCMAMAVLQVLHRMRPEVTGRVIISCDNDEALRQGIEYDLWPKAMAPHHDMVAQLHRLRREIPYELHPSRVQGHQDTKSSQPLTRLEELNVIADEAAKTYAYKIERSNTVQANLCLSQSQWRLCLNGEILKKHIRSSIYDFVLGNQLKDTWVEKGKFERNHLSMIDWEAMRMSIKRKPVHHRRWATKFISGFCGSNYKLHQMGKHDTPLCPRCNLMDETTAHILYCQHATSKENRSEAVSRLSRWLENTQTRWDIRETIVSTLSAIQPTSTLHANVPFNPYDNGIFTAARAQDMIGLQNMLEGFISIEWRRIMAHHYREIKSSRTSLSWAAGLHVELQKFCRSQWDHRNSVVHARNEKGRKLTKEAEIRSRLEYQLQLGVRNLPPYLHHLANFDTDQAMTQPRTKMLSWLHHLELARPFYEEEETRETNSQRIFLRHWLRL